MIVETPMKVCPRVCQVVRHSRVRWRDFGWWHLAQGLTRRSLIVVAEQVRLLAGQAHMLQPAGRALLRREEVPPGVWINWCAHQNGGSGLASERAHGSAPCDLADGCPPQLPALPEPFGCPLFGCDQLALVLVTWAVA